MSTVTFENFNEIKCRLKGQAQGWRSPCLAVLLGQESNLLVMMG